MHSASATLVGLAAAIVLDSTQRFVRLGLTIETAAWACALSAAVAALAALGSHWATLAPSVAVRERLSIVGCTALFGAWFAIFCVRSRWGWLSLDRLEAGSGPPAQLAIVLFPLSGLTASFFGRYLSTRASSANT